MNDNLHTNHHNNLHSEAQSPILIIGSGAIALLSASQCALAGQPCYLQGRSVLDGKTLAVDFRRGQQNFPLLISQRPASLTQFSTILVAVKAYDAVQACEQWLPLLTEHGNVVLCHNGMGTIDPVAALLTPKQKLWFASTTHGALKHGQHQLEHTGLGLTRWGAANLAAEDACAASEFHVLATQLQHALGPAQFCLDIQAVLWQKLLVNAVINPLTALHQCRNGDLRQPQFQTLIQQLVAEFVQVASAQGVHLPNALDTVYQVIDATAKNYSSMQQDVEKHRKTELKAITGVVLQQATRLQLETPSHQRLWQQLTQQLQSWQY